MKKKIAIALVMAVMLLSLAGCSKRKTVSVTIGNIGNFEITQLPAGFTNLSAVDNTMTLTLEKYGEYPVTVKAEDGTEHSFVVKYEKGTVSVDAEDLDIMVGTK